MTEEQTDYHDKLAFFHNKDDTENDDFNKTYATGAPELSDNNPEVTYGSFGFGPIIETVKESVIPLKDANILEIGGASGLLASKLQDMGANLTLLETQQNFTQEAQKKGINNVITYDGTNPQNSLYGKEFDAIIASRVFEDIVMPEYKALNLVRKLTPFLKPGGKIIIATQQPTAVWEEAIQKGSDSKLIESKKFSDAGYVKQVNVYKTNLKS